MEKQTPRSLARLAKGIDPQSCAFKLRLAVLGHRSTQFFCRFVRQYGLVQGLNIEVFEGGYKQAEVELMDPNSSLYEFKPQVLCLVQSVLHLRSIFYSYQLEGRPDFHLNYLDSLREMAQTCSETLGARFILTNFEEIDDGVFGHYGNNTRFSFLNQLRRINLGIMDMAEESSIQVFDMAQIAAAEGWKLLHDPAMHLNADLPYSLEVEMRLAKSFVNSLKVSLGMGKKCLILDLDHTLWGGIIGDDGLEGIQIGHTGIGKAYREVQMWIKELKNRGIILAVCSKNEENLAKEPFEALEDMVLSLDDFAIFVANWNNKADNIRYIQEVLNIGFDSMVFLDDNKAERELVRQELPDVTVPELPADPGSYLPFLIGLNLFETQTYSPTDKERTKKYQQEGERKMVEKNFSQIDGFLRHLEIKGSFLPFQQKDRGRIAQLSQRSNQFNLRTLRYSEADIDRIMKEAEYFSIQVSLTDKYGSHGLVSIISGKKQGRNRLFIENWIMSCRVINKGVELAALNVLVEKARKKGIRQIIGEFIPTPKNALVSKHYEKLGFVQSKANTWVLELDDFQEKAHFIEIV